MNDRIDINALAKLSKIKISDKDLPKMHQDLESILSLCQKMNKSTLSKPSSQQQTDTSQALLRQDVVSERNRREQYACGDRRPYYVPKIID